MSSDENQQKPKTRLLNVGRDPSLQEGFINPPIYKGSTVLFPDAKSIKANVGAYTYGRHATPTSRALCDALTELECGHDTVLTSSGQAAITLVFSTFAKQGAHYLVTDTAYAPTRFCLDQHYKKLGVEVTYFDPHIGSNIEELITDKTALIFCESPGSLSFEIHDLPALTAVAKKHDIPVAIDNTWASPYFHKPLTLGCDISLHSGAKYMLGHSDGFFGSVTSTEPYFADLYQTRKYIGHCASSDEAHMGLRGLRTLAVRLEQHMVSGLALAQWFDAQGFVDKVLHPALPSHPDHDLWLRDFTGAGGLFSVIFKPVAQDILDDCVNNLNSFGLGFSYGGYESLVLPFDPRNIRTATSWEEGPAVRFYAGLEDVDDLIADLDRAFSPLR